MRSTNPQSLGLPVRRPRLPRARALALSVAVVVALAGATALAQLDKRLESRNGMVSSANGLASEAGVEMLRAGGNAVDAAVATAFAIGVVEPQMSGLGGSGAAVVWMKKARQASYLDFYAAQHADSWRTALSPAEPEAPAGRAPAAPNPSDLRIVGVPGEVAGLLALHEKFGVLPRARVMEPAIRLAENGFPIGQVLAGFIASSSEKLRRFPDAAALFLPGDKPLAPGATLRNPALAASLRRVAEQGRRGFYEGPTADALLSVMSAGGHPVTREVLAGFEPQWKRPLCTDYRGHAVLSAAPPQTGFQVLHTLELLEPYDLKKLGLPNRSAAAFDTLVSALRVGQADAAGNGDPNWVAVPANGISSAAFAAERRALVGARPAATSIQAASAAGFDRTPPAGACGLYDPYGPASAVQTTSGLPADRMGAAADTEQPTDTEQPPDGEEPAGGETTHISVVDKDGNAVALTQTNSSVFGSGAMAAGFFLNDSGFRFTPANIDAPSRSRWRVRNTTIAPTIVLKDHKVQMVIGAPGSGRIPTEIVQVMVYTLDYGMDPLDAVRMPRIYPSPRNTSVQLEHGFTPEFLGELRGIGYDPVNAGAEYARLYMIVRRGKSWIGVADTRHDGEPRGH